MLRTAHDATPTCLVGLSGTGNRPWLCQTVPVRSHGRIAGRRLNSFKRRFRWSVRLVSGVVLALCPVPALSGGGGSGALAQVQPGAEVAPVDRILAVVNGEPITYSEVMEAIALLPGATPPPTLEEALERLIDARLMEHEARRYLQEPPSEEEGEATLRALMDRFATAEDYRATLRRLGIAEDYLRKRIQRELIVDRYVDRRFRPLVQVAQRDVEEYYRAVLLPDLPAGSPTTLVEVEPLIRNILEQRDLNRRISAWVDELKSSASIVRLPLPEPPQFNCRFDCQSDSTSG